MAINSNMKKKKKYGLRAFINDVHLWLGVGSGIILFLVCFSGTILTFEHEIKDFFTPTVEIKIQETKPDIAALVNTVKNSGNSFVTGISIPVKNNTPYTFSVKKDLKERRSSKILVNPYTANISTIKKTPADSFLMSMFKLHRWLLLDINIGRPIVGIATIIFIILTISGLVLWFPKKLKWRNLKQGFKIKTNANWKRINHDLHNTLGFYSCIFILIMAITGLCWSFESYREGLGNLIGAKIFDRGSTKFDIPEHVKTVSINDIITTANSTLQYQGELSINFPNSRSNFYTISKSNTNNWSPVMADRLYIAPSGKLLKTDLFKDKPLNTQIAALIRPIHTGEIYGTFSKILYFLACLIGTSLPITGTIIWINKLKKKRKKNNGIK